MNDNEAFFHVECYLFEQFLEHRKNGDPLLEWYLDGWFELSRNRPSGPVPESMWERVGLG